MYQSLFLPKGTGTDWRSAFRQQEELLKKAVNNVTLPEINNPSLKESKSEKVRTILDNIKKDQGYIKTRELR